ncbi:MAG: succinate dehydrogenase, cytochrome b556 subunit [bacterium]|nr:succinate dehydrogenase, cytochrome b556 subunit [bacterium]
MTPDKRPLSPHLQIYRPQLTSILSIVHRLTGFALSIGFGALVCWIVALAVGGGYLTDVHSFWGTFFGKLLLLGWLFCFVYHFFNGIRHLFWDAGLGLELPAVYGSGWAVLALSGIGTLGLWWCGGGF